MKKTNLFNLVELAIQGEEVIICKAGIPMAKLVEIKTTQKKSQGIGLVRLKSRTTLTHCHMIL